MVKKIKVKRHLRRIKKKRKVTVIRKHRRKIRKRKNRGRDPSQFDTSFKFPFTSEKVAKKRIKLPASEVERTRVCRRCTEIFRTRKKFSKICPGCALPTTTPTRKSQKLLFPREKRTSIREAQKRAAELDKARLKWREKQR